VTTQVGNSGVRPQSLADTGHQPQAPRPFPPFFPAAAVATTLPSMGQQFRLSQQVSRHFLKLMFVCNYQRLKLFLIFGYYQVIPDALTTMSQYLGGLEQVLAINGKICFLMSLS
jgi:hypothetical protein